MITLTDDEITVRYERSNNRYAVRVWGHQSANLLASSTGDAGHEPKWLADIIAVARVGGQMQRVKSAPPDELVWFTINADKQLINFDKDFQDADKDL